MRNVIKEITQKGWAVWAFVIIGDAPVVFFTNKACKYIGLMIEKSLKKEIESKEQEYGYCGYYSYPEGHIEMKKAFYELAVAINNNLEYLENIVKLV